MPQLDTSFYINQIFWLFICFCLFLGFTKYIFYPKLKENIANRHNFFKTKENQIHLLEEKIRNLQQEHEWILFQTKQAVALQKQERLLQLEERKMLHYKTLEKELEEVLKKFKENFLPSIPKNFIQKQAQEILRHFP